MTSAASIWQTLQNHPITYQHAGRRVVLMLCGVAGAGKSTLSYKVKQDLPSYIQLSIDSIIAERHGIYAVDYPPEMYQEYQKEADELYLKDFTDLLTTGKANIILDRSFYAKEDRDLFRRLAEEHHYEVVLVYLDVDKEVLWQRICDRQAKTRRADNALDIDRPLLDRFCEGFEVPSGEGEMVFRCLEEPEA